MATAEEGSPHPKISQQFDKDSFKETLNKALVSGDTWYLLDNKWFNQCTVYLGFDEGGGGKDEDGGADANPGPIDNKELFNQSEPGELKDHMIEQLDYVLVPTELWEPLVNEFGLVEGQEPISRIVREFGMFVKHPKVEIYFLELQLTQYGFPENIVKRKFSKADTIGKILEEMKRAFDLKEEQEVRVWNKFSSNTFEKLPNLDSTVQESGLFSGQTVQVEVKGEDGSWPRASTSAAASTNGASDLEKSTSKIPPPPRQPGAEKKESSPSVSSLSTASSSKYSGGGGYMDGGSVEDGRPGICGLSNIGNTCFMNSILQGLSNTPAIAEYFENDNFEEDVNEDNPLGMKGEVARAFGQLIKDIWSGRYSYVVPRNFKMVVGRFAPQFSGYQQQDSQELLTFLLDGLHEDLNRIKKKPYVEMSDSDDREDTDIAREAWENYKKRNNSVILDIFHGLLKSTLVCPQCNKISVTFDPMCYLSLPLPVKKERQIEVFFVSMSPSAAPVQYKVTCPKSGFISDLTQALSKLVNVPANCLTATDVYSNRFHKIFSPGDQLSNIMEKDDVFIYEVADPEDKNQMTVPVYLRQKKHNSGYSPTSLFGQPFLFSFPVGLTEEGLYDHLLDRMSRYVTRPAADDDWWKPVPKEKVVKMELSGDSPTDNSEAQTPNSEGSPTSETSNMPVIQDEEMNSDDEDEEPDSHVFSLKMVNAYGNSQLPDPVTDDNGTINIRPNQHLGLDWRPKAKDLFFKEKAAEDFSQDASLNSTAQPKKQVTNLAECLQLYTSQEKLGEDDAWYCPRCKAHQQATKKFDLWMLPEVLIISLKRFSYNKYWRDKIDIQVDFPVHGLDLSPYVIAPGHGPAVYDLIGVSNHYGGMGGGHYTAYCKNRIDDKWYYFDDSSVTEAKESSVVSKAAYVLFYQRRNVNNSAVNRNNIPAAAGSAAGLTNGTNGVSSSDEDMETA